MPVKVALIVGTRPEAIKLVPVALVMRQRPDVFRLVLIATAQHREMLDQVLAIFDLQPDYDLDIMRPDQSPFEVTTKVLTRLQPVLEAERPDLVIVQGDTTSTFAGALAAFYLKIPVAHVEAGLRTYDKHQPFPEEIRPSSGLCSGGLAFCAHGVGSWESFTRGRSIGTDLRHRQYGGGCFADDFGPSDAADARFRNPTGARAAPASGHRPSS